MTVAILLVLETQLVLQLVMVFVPASHVLETALMAVLIVVIAMERHVNLIHVAESVLPVAALAVNVLKMVQIIVSLAIRHGADVTKKLVITDLIAAKIADVIKILFVEDVKTFHVKNVERLMVVHATMELIVRQKKTVRTNSISRSSILLAI